MTDDELYATIRRLRGDIEERGFTPFAPAPSIGAFREELEYHRLSLQCQLDKIRTDGEVQQLFERTHWLVLAGICHTLAGVAAMPASDAGGVAQALRDAAPALRTKIDSYLRAHDAIIVKRDVKEMTAFVDNVREVKRDDPAFGYLRK